MDLSNIIQASASIQNPSINRLGFGEPAIYGRDKNTVIPLSARSRRYSSATALTDMLADGFFVCDPIYLAASAILQQSPKPQSFKVLAGRSDFTYSARLTCTDAAADDELSLTIRGENPALANTILEEEVAVTGTGAAIGNATALHAALVATGFDPGTVTFTDNGNGTIDIDGAAANDIVWLDDLYNVSVVDLTADRGIAAEYAAILAKDADWYELIPADAYGAAELELLATAIQASTNKYHSAQTQDSTVVSAGTGIGETLKGADRTKTTLIYAKNALDEFRNAASSAIFLAKDPGTYQRAFKSLSGVHADELTTAEISNAFSDFVNVYVGVSKGGVELVAGDLQRGHCSGITESYADTYRLIDATISEIQIRVYTALRVADKIPMTDAGLTTIRGAIIEAIKSFGSLAYQLDTIVCNMPLAANISAADRSARIVRGISAGATFAGAVNRVIMALTFGF
jgi:hypothetical protein